MTVFIILYCVNLIGIQECVFIYYVFLSHFGFLYISKLGGGIDPKTFLLRIESLLKQGDNAIELEMETQFNSAEENKKGEMWRYPNFHEV